MIRYRVLIANDGPQFVARRGFTELREFEAEADKYLPSCEKVESYLSAIGRIQSGWRVVLVELMRV